MNKKSLILALVGVTLLAALAAGGTWVYKSRNAGVQDAAAPVVKADRYKYVGIDRIVVMLRGESDPNDAPSYEDSHYAVVDLVLKTTADKEEMAREHMLLLRSLAVNAVSGYSLDQIRRKNVPEIAAAINSAFVESYKSRHVEMPFETAMISKLLAE